MKIFNLYGEAWDEPRGRVDWPPIDLDRPTASWTSVPDRDGTAAVRASS